jgi:hypothetical protein
VLARIEEEAQWDGLTSSPASRSWLESSARAALEEHERATRCRSIRRIDGSNAIKDNARVLEVL